MQAIFHAILAMFQLFATPVQAAVSLPEPRDTDTRNTGISQDVIASLTGYRMTGYQSMAGDTRHPRTHAHPHD